MPEISVLVPVCNVENYLEQCLDSLISQSFNDIEIICVDDGSTDQSGAILDRYAASDRRLTVIHKKNTGYGNSMNVAMDRATGNYLAILESDDFAEPDMLQKLYEAASAHGADVVKGNYYNYWDGKDVFSNRVGNYPTGELLNSHACPELLNLPDTIWSCLYKRSFLCKHKIRFHETPGASYQDISFALQVWLYAEKVYIIHDPLLHYRRDNPNSSMNNPSKLFCVFDEYQWAEEKLGDALDKDIRLREHFAASKYGDFLNHYYRVGVQFQYALLVRLEQLLREDREKGWITESAFVPSVWDQIGDIGRDMDAFFKKTARVVWDARLAACKIKNREVYRDAFFAQLTAYSKVFVYGAGQVGKRLAKGILERDGQVDAFLVTSLKAQEPVCMEIPVMEVQDAALFADTSAVVIAVTEWSQYELYRILEKHGFRNIFRTDEVIREVI